MLSRNSEKIIDLSAPIDPNFWEPNPVVRKIINHKKGGDLLGKSLIYVKGKKKLSKFREWIKHKLGFGLDHRSFPDKKGLSLMTYTLTTHTGTHMDAPYHYSDVNACGIPAKTISEIPLSWCYNDGVLLRLSHVLDLGPIQLDEVKNCLSQMNYTLKPFDIVLLETGADRFIGKPEYFTHYRGVSLETTEWLISNGIKIIGIDSFGFDAPFGNMVKEYMKTGNPSNLWPSHIYGRTHEYCQLERLVNLTKLTKFNNFKVACFPIHLQKADASWCRVVAIVG